MARKPKKTDDEPSPNGTHAPTAVAEAPAPQAATAQNSQPPPEPKNGPVKSYSCPVNGGTIEVAIWGKQIKVDDREITVYSATITKNFRNELGEWKHTNFLRGTEIAVAIRLLDRAATFMIDVRTEEVPEF